jgi:uncharacterized membrane protein
MNNIVNLIFPALGLIVSGYMFVLYSKIKKRTEQEYKFYAPVYLMVAVVSGCMSIFLILFMLGLVK